MIPSRLFQTGLQALHFAAKRNNIELADELIKRGAKVNCATLVSNSTGADLGSGFVRAKMLCRPWVMREGTTVSNSTRADPGIGEEGRVQ